MAGDVTFRGASEPAASTPSVAKSTPDSTVATSTVEVPYLDYEREHSKPLSVDYFGLGDKWNEPTWGFPQEIAVIEGYFKDLVSSGEIANSSTAIKDRMKEILKVTNMTKEERNVIKLETIAAYIKFLTEKDGISKSVKRYGSA